MIRLGAKMHRVDWDVRIEDIAADGVDSRQSLNMTGIRFMDSRAHRENAGLQTQRRGRRQRYVKEKSQSPARTHDRQDLEFGDIRRELRHRGCPTRIVRVTRRTKDDWSTMQSPHSG